VVTNTDGTTVTTAYQGRQAAVLDELGHQTIRERDAFGRLVSSRQYLGVFTGSNWSATAYVTATYSYNIRDQLNSVVVSDGVTPAVTTSSMTYDTAGRKTAMTDADLGAWSYPFDKLRAGSTMRPATC
jgi:YD repeat-containing protein